MNHTANGRRIALFPGAFRPPHAAHFAAVQELASRPDVDEVVVVVSNRSRSLRGTTKVMGPDVSQRVWEIFLSGLPRVRVEIAPRTAIEHALAYFGRCQPGDSLLFCLGETDHARSDPRFSALSTLSTSHEVKASVVAARTGGLPVRATDLRDALRAGPAGRAGFLNSLPAHLSPVQKQTVWNTCREGLREMDDAAIDRARTLVSQWELGDAREIGCVHRGKLDPVVRVEFTSGQVVFVKDAGDTIDAGTVGDRALPKPAARIGVERRAIRRLGRVDGIELPEVVWFDKESRTLVLSEVCPSGTSLQSQLDRGVFDPHSAEAIGGALAALHGREISPLWGDADADVAHWRRMLAVRTTGLDESVQTNLGKLYTWSDQSLELGFVHLDCVPKNIRIGSIGVGVIDLELSASRGDRAYDLGCLMAHYILHGFSRGVVTLACRVFERLVRAYRRTVDEAYWRALEPRMIAFGGAEVLCQSRSDSNDSNTPGIRTIGARLLSSGLSAGDLFAVPRGLSAVLRSSTTGGIGADPTVEASVNQPPIRDRDGRDSRPRSSRA